MESTKKQPKRKPPKKKVIEVVGAGGLPRPRADRKQALVLGTDVRPAARLADAFAELALVI